MRLDLLTAVAAANAVLAGALLWLWSDDGRRRWVEPEPLPPALEEVAVVPAAEPADGTRYRETLERPLFLATRRPGPKKDAAGESQDAAEVLRDVRLIGTYGAGDRGGIIISRAGKVERLPVGASIGQWKVGGGEGRGATFVRADGERRTLELALNVAAASPAAAGQGDAAKAGAVDQARGAAEARPAGARAATNAGATPREQIRSQRLERLNARRAQAGLPPLPE